MTRQLVAVTTHFPSPTVWTYNYAYRRTTREIVRTITEAMDVVYWEYQNVYITAGVDSTVDVDVTQARTQQQNNVTPTTAAPVPANLPSLYTSFSVRVFYVAETIYIGGVTQTIPFVTTIFDKAPPLAVTKTITSTATNGQVVTQTVTATETASASLDGEAHGATTITTTTTTVIGGTPTVTTIATRTTLANIVVTEEVKTITVFDEVLTQRCQVTKTARPSNIFRGGIRIQVTIVIEIFEFFFFELGIEQTSTTTVTSTVTVSVGPTATGNGTISATGTSTGNSTLSRTTGGMNVDPSGNSSTIATTTSGGISTQTPVVISYEIDFTVVAIIYGEYYSFCACGSNVCGKPNDEITAPSNNTDVSTGTTPFQFVITETGLLVISTTLEVVYFESLANPCPVSFGSDTTEIVTVVESLKIVWIANDDGTLTCYRNGVQVVFYTCTEVSGAVQLFAADSSAFFDVSVCTQVVLNVNNTIGGGHTPGGNSGGGSFNGTTGGHGGHNGTSSFPGGPGGGFNNGTTGGNGTTSGNGNSGGNGNTGGHHHHHNGSSTSTGGSTSGSSGSTTINNFNTINNYFNNIVNNVVNNNVVNNYYTNNTTTTSNSVTNNFNVNSGNTVTNINNGTIINNINSGNTITTNVNSGNTINSNNNISINSENTIGSGNTVNVNSTTINSSSQTTVNNNDNSITVSNNTGSNININANSNTQSIGSGNTINNNSGSSPSNGTSSPTTYPTGSFSLGGEIDGVAVVIVLINGELRAVSTSGTTGVVFTAIVNGILADVNGNKYGLVALGDAITVTTTSTKKMHRRFAKRDLAITWQDTPNGPVAYYNGQPLVFSTCQLSGSSSLNLDLTSVSGCSAFTPVVVTAGANVADVPQSSSTPTTTAGNNSTTPTTASSQPTNTSNPIVTGGAGSNSTSPTQTTDLPISIPSSTGDSSPTNTGGSDSTGPTTSPTATSGSNNGTETTATGPSSSPTGTGNDTLSSRRRIRRKFADRIRF